MISSSEDRIPLTAIVVRAVVYALAAALLVLYAPGGEHVFIYQGF